MSVRASQRYGAASAAPATMVRNAAAIMAPMFCAAAPAAPAVNVSPMPMPSTSCPTRRPSRGNGGVCPANASAATTKSAPIIQGSGTCSRLNTQPPAAAGTYPPRDTIPARRRPGTEAIIGMRPVLSPPLCPSNTRAASREWRRHAQARYRPGMSRLLPAVSSKVVVISTSAIAEANGQLLLVLNSQ